MDSSNLLKEVNAFRSALKELSWSGFPFQISITNEFPFASCDDSSMLLAAYLSDQGWPGSIRISGMHGGKDEELFSHVWLKLDQMWIDITGSQFEDYSQPEILLAEQDSFLETFDVEDDTEFADFRLRFANDHRFLGYFSEAYEAVLARMPHRLA